MSRATGAYTMMASVSAGALLAKRLHRAGDPGCGGYFDLSPGSHFCLRA